MERRALPLAVQSLAFEALSAIVIGGVVGGVGFAVASHPSDLWRPAITGVALFFVFGLVFVVLLYRRIGDMSPAPLPDDATADRSLRSYILARIRRPGRVLVSALIVGALLLGDPALAVYLAAIGVGLAPGYLAMAGLLRTWERKNGALLVREVDRRHRKARALPYYTVAAPPVEAW
jgi:hypothetical protein